MGRRRTGKAINGWLVLDKPAGFYSMRATNHVRRLFEAQKAGHAGTLDPLATGILPIALGIATRTIPYVVAMKKEYIFTIRWGASTDTDDADGQITERCSARPHANEIEAVLPSFCGMIEQLPPRYSAIRIKGRRAYELARRDEDIELRPRPVLIESLEYLSSPCKDEAVFRCRSGKGAYIRSLARDMGERLGCLGHIVHLRRLQVGVMDEAVSVTFEQLEQALAQGEDVHQFLCPADRALAYAPHYAITRSEAVRLWQGAGIIAKAQEPLRACGAIPQSDMDEGQSHLSPDPSLVVARYGERAVALLRWKEDHVLKAICVFPQ